MPTPIRYSPATAPTNSNSAAEGATYAEIAAPAAASAPPCGEPAPPPKTICSPRRAALSRLVPRGRHHHHRSQIRLRPLARRRIENAARHRSPQEPLRYVPTFLGAHEIPDEYRGRMHEYIALGDRRNAPAVAAKLAEYCDVFCEPNVFPHRRQPPYPRRRPRMRSWPAPARRPVLRFRRCRPGRRTGRRHRRSSGTHRHARHPGAQSRRSAARAAARLGLRARHPRATLPPAT